ncbi:O-antigen ligase family protein [Solirubrobacter taibaiensis]|nr:O-antigen ligase family protein [Solirubrobacter taibaiensis]
MALASGALALLAIWTLASATWSDAPARALAEFDRTLLYALVLVLTGSAVARVGDLAVLLRWTAAAFAAVALAGLLTRLAPGTFPIGPGYLPERIAFPLTYWNAMGIACALCVLFAFHLSASGKEPRIIRVLAAAVVPMAAVTLYLTFSRGAIWALPLGLVLYVLCAQARGLVSAAIAAVPAGVAVSVAYGAELLARADYDSAAAAPEARRVGLTVAACCAAAALLRAVLLFADTRIERVKLPRYARVGFVGGTLVVLIAGALAVGAPARARDAVDTFREGSALSVTDLRNRLTSAVDNGRVEHWKVALDGYRESPLHGTGAGTYRITWDRERELVFKVTDGHSLYFEILSELGIVGLVLLVVVLGTILVGAALGLRGEERHAHAFVLAGGAMLAVHAGIDWDWEMPALFVWFFAAGGMVLASRSPRLGEIGRTARIVAALAVLLLAITPALFWWSQGPLDDAGEAWNARDCPTAIDRALTATERFGTRPEPWVMLAYCDTRLGDYTLARRAVDAAHRRDPNNWQVVYAQAIVYGVSGADPRPYAAEALRLNPQETYTKQLVEDLRAAKTEARRREVAGRALIPPYGY